LLQKTLTVNHHSSSETKGEKGMPSANQDRPTNVFDRETYVKMLISIARADKDNSLPEYRFIRKQAIHLGVNYEQVLKDTDRDFEIGTHQVSRMTALRVLKDAIMIASMDGNFSLPEKQKLYTYAEKLDIPRTDVDDLETLVGQLKELDQRWKELVAGHPDE
jgi:uncharacterized tellurite resistance protein B-like protein